MSATPTIDERLARAANTSDLSVTPERNGDGYTLIAAAKTPRVVGRHLIALHGEWDGCSKPRRPLAHDLLAIYRTLPRATTPPPELTPDQCKEWHRAEREGREAEAKSIASGWYEQERLRAFARLRSLDRVCDGLVEIVQGRVEEPAPKVKAVIAWWLDHVCPVCCGTRYELMEGQDRLSNRVCKACNGKGERPLPHGQAGRVIERAIDDCIGRARQSIAEYRRNLLAGVA
ncbi:MAG: hypothetical protein EOO22_00805 [Comamonadaceae bacterium]|nr:MAG: hypothetical protein EOO22_00805 [Comamonadaceae bacterium]